MRKYITAVFCFMSALMFASCSSDSQNDQQNTNENGTAVVAPDSTLTEQKKELLMFAARNNMLQIELGRMAVSQAETKNAKEFGQQLVDWYTTKQNELQDIAQQYNVTLPTSLTDKQLKHIKDVEGTKAEKFDLEYYDSVKDAQRAAIKEFEKNLKDIEKTSYSAFSIWARKTAKELHAQRTKAAALEVELKNREGGISNSI